MNIDFSFIIIDDSELDRFVTQKFLELSTKYTAIKAFENAEHALETIRENADGNSPVPTIILLDLQMPFMNGFDFVEQFEKFPNEVKNNYRIVILTILTSASNPADIYKVLTYPTVSRIIEKPLTKEKLQSLLIQV
ncbi:response regulator [Mucilaginibacter ginsenosidivorans]|uniref:Response regulator n=1 Tax=Mucilaginibacter ginsenosidivorans TaxID=398053 RepID=A0A5B8V0K0_9SPHI|nr:response regulator [Mucilaginibacter ginsenosidivorans]QEC64333.1 response regulator [Mucilaginibacter ginsenosidivorans]